MAIRLTVQNFSCIESAEVELRDLTVIIGAQSSGKSVICKLVYFFVDLALTQTQLVEDKLTISELREHLKRSFRRWFPTEAWGNQKFAISFFAGPFEVHLTRTSYNNSLGDDFRVTFSKFIEQTFNKLVAEHQDFLESSGDIDPERAFFRIYDYNQRLLADGLGHDFVRSQLFVPAGRSFFTSMGRAIFAFEQGNILDPVTLRFGRAFMKEREDFGIRRRGGKRNHESMFSRDAIRAFFGGDLVIDRGQEHVRTSDGRKIPFSLMSSGHQEILPLLMVLGRPSAPTSPKRPGRRLVFIEEPEAHLFPSAQGLVVEVLAETVSSTAPTPGRLVMTTHSPHVLSKINNLIKAGELGQSRNRATAVESIIPRHCWLSPTQVAAYAIENRRLRPITDHETNLIDGSYLDSVSGVIGKEFEQLLEIEFGSTEAGNA